MHNEALGCIGRVLMILLEALGLYQARTLVKKLTLTTRPPGERHSHQLSRWWTYLRYMLEDSYICA